MKIDIEFLACNFACYVGQDRIHLITVHARRFAETRAGAPTVIPDVERKMAIAVLDYY